MLNTNYTCEYLRFIYLHKSEWEILIWNKDLTTKHYATVYIFKVAKLTGSTVYT